MGATCACGSKSSANEDLHTQPIITEANQTQLSGTSELTTNNHSSEEVLDENLKSQITEGIDEYIVSINTAFQTERDRIVNEMSSLAPEPYLGLLYSDYPDRNGTSVNEMARRLVTSKEAKQRLTDQIIERIEPSFLSRTADWNSNSLETARSDVKTFIEKLVGDAFDRVELA